MNNTLYVSHEIHHEEPLFPYCYYPFTLLVKNLSRILITVMIVAIVKNIIWKYFESILPCEVGFSEQIIEGPVTN